MLYVVRKSFLNIDGAFLRPGDVVECDIKRARVLMRNGLIGRTAEQNKPMIPENAGFGSRVETAEEKPQKRKYRKRMKPDEVDEPDDLAE